MGTESPILVLERVQKRILSPSPKGRGQKSMVMVMSPDRVSKRVLGTENPEEAQSIYGAPPVCQAFCYSLMLLDPHPYGIDVHK